MIHGIIGLTLMSIYTCHWQSLKLIYHDDYDDYTDGGGFSEQNDDTVCLKSGGRRHPCCKGKSCKSFP